MPDFKEAQKKYLQAKAAYKQAAEQKYLAQQQYLLLCRHIEELLAKELLKELPAGHELASQEAKARQQLTEAETRFTNTQNALTETRKVFSEQGSASTTVSNINDATPILLLPLRIQTRFLITKHFTRNFSDDMLVDFGTLQRPVKERVEREFSAFKPIMDPLSSTNFSAFVVSNSREGQDRRIVEEINLSRGDRRPKDRLVKVEDVYELWVRIFPDDLFLQSHETSVTVAEAQAGRVFWQAMWEAEREFKNNANGAEASTKKREKELQAWKTLRSFVLSHRAAWIAGIMRPADYPDAFPQTMEQIPAEKFPTPIIKADSWTIPPTTELLPEHFTVRLSFSNPDLPGKEVVGASIPDFLQLGFDPDERDEDAFAEKGNTLELPSSIRWLTDLNEAEKIGMAIRVSLTLAEYASGIDKLVVVGIKTGTNEQEGSALLTTLFDNHHYKPDGMAFLAQGTATNNLPGQASGFVKGGLNDEQSFESEFRSNNVPADSDGRRLATALGLNEKTFDSIYNSELKEGEQALAFNKALWSATLGYYLDNHMRPNATDNDIAFTKSFFQNYVAGGGLLPSLRIGKQPYGVVPTSAWSKWKANETASEEEKRLAKLLKKLDSQWGRLIDSVKTMKKALANTDEQQLKNDFREILSMQPSSTVFFRRLVAGEYLLWNTNALMLPLNQEKVGIATAPSTYKARLENIDAWQQSVNPRPKILTKFFDNDNYKLTELAVDALTGNLSDGSNYLSFLVDRNFEQLKTNAFAEDWSKFLLHRSSSLLFFTARFALLQGWLAAAVEILRQQNPSISPFAKLDFEIEYMEMSNSISFEHQKLLEQSGLATNLTTIKNKWTFLEQQINGTRLDAIIEQRLKEQLSDDDPVKPLQEMMEAFKILSKLPVDRLEKVFSEHIDLCSFRLDAWLQGLALSRLFQNRKAEGFERGTVIGAFGYVESLKPGTDRWIEVKEVKTPPVKDAFAVNPNEVVLPMIDFSEISSEQWQVVRKHMFIYLGSDLNANLVEDPVSKKIIVPAASISTADAGFVVTPSLEHAATASILRAGYEHHSLSDPQSKTLAVNLNSERTSWAMELLKGMQSGHSLNEQLGYFIERKMYDRLTLPQYIPNLRAAFPLQIERHEWDNNQQINQQEKVQNLSLVTDGLAIVQLLQTTFDLWMQKVEPVFGSDRIARSDFENIARLALEQFDAVSDLIIAESVYQTVKGSPERAAAALRILGEASDINLPEVANINGEHRVVTHRMGFVLNQSSNNSWSAQQSMYADIAPALNNWLADQLPNPQKIIVKALTADGSAVKINIASMSIQAIDFFYLLQKTGLKPQESLISWWSKEIARQTSTDKEFVAVNFDRDESFALDEYSIADLLPLIKTIGSLLEQSRAMRPEDFSLLADSKSANLPSLYDNSQLLDVLRKLTEANDNNTFSQYLKKLTDSKGDLNSKLSQGFESSELTTAFLSLMQLIPQSFALGFWDSVPRCAPVCNAQNVGILLDQTNQLINKIQKRITDTQGAFTALQANSNTLSADKVFDGLAKIAKQFAGADFLILPSFHLPDTASLAASLNDTSLAQSIGEFGVVEWVQGLSMVRDNIRSYQNFTNLRAVFDSEASNRNLNIIQLPYLTTEKNTWIGNALPEKFQPSVQVTSMAYEFSAAFNPIGLVSGILLDDWREKVPLPQHTAGVSIKFNQANAEAPQCLLLVVAPEMKGAWEWTSIVDSVLETMTLAKKRAVDSELIQTTWLSQFLPAIVTPIDSKNNTPTLDFKVAGPLVKPSITDVLGGDVIRDPGTVINRFENL